MESPRSTAPTAPGLGGLLMVGGGALCLLGGILVAAGTQATIMVGPTAASIFVRFVPLAAGAALVGIGAAVRRALRRAWELGAADTERRLRGESRGQLPPGAGA